MKLLFSPKFISSLILILAVALVVKIGWFVVELAWLDKKGVEFSKPSEVKALYYRTRFASQQLKQPKETPTIVADTIDSIKLLALYHSNDRVVVTVSKKGKTSVLVRGDTIDGYTLDGATSTEALFLRDEKLYRIELSKSSSNNGKSSISYADRPKISAPKISENISKEIVNIDGITTIDKKLLEKYSQNMDDIWKNIGINEKKVDGKTIGFKVNFVKKGSDFAKLGLRRGDLIVAINGDALDNYAKALDVYSNIETIEDLTLRIKRGREEMELEYAIK